MSETLVARKFISIISTSLRNFTTKKADEWNFSCPLCGDSQKDKRKRRGYIFLYKNNYFFKCHNCQLSLRFDKFLEQFDQNLYNSYLLEVLSSKPNTTKDTKVSVPIKKITVDLPKLCDLPTTHMANQYYHSRQLPEAGKELLYYTNDFKNFQQKTIQNPKYDNLEPYDKRIVIPYYDFDGNFIGCQGRSLNPNTKLRYITAKLENCDFPLIFGLNTVDYSQKIYVLEGAFDSLLIPNAIAVNTSNLVRVSEFFSEKVLNNMVMVHDHQPRNPPIMQEMHKSIQKNFQVCIFPSNIMGKDLNEMHLHGHNVYDIIKENTFQGMDANIRFLNYKRC